MYIKKICRKKGITQVQIASKLGISPSALSQSLHGNPTLKRLQDIANILEIELTDLIRYGNERGK